MDSGLTIERCAEAAISPATVRADVQSSHGTESGPQSERTASRPGALSVCRQENNVLLAVDRHNRGPGEGEATDRLLGNQETRSARSRSRYKSSYSRKIHAKPVRHDVGNVQSAPGPGSISEASPSAPVGTRLNVPPSAPNGMPLQAL